MRKSDSNVVSAAGAIQSLMQGEPRNTRDSPEPGKRWNPSKETVLPVTRGKMPKVCTLTTGRGSQLPNYNSLVYFTN
jgi:hypothetical protein